MLDTFPIDIILIIFHLSKFNHVKNLLTINKNIYTNIDDDFYKYLCYIYYSNTFWEKAKARDESISKPFKSWKKEFIRLEIFQIKTEKILKKRWKEEDFYIYWNFLGSLN